MAKITQGICEICMNGEPKGLYINGRGELCCIHRLREIVAQRPEVLTDKVILRRQSPLRKVGMHIE